MKRSSTQKRILIVSAALLVVFSLGLFMTPEKAMASINPGQSTNTINVLDLTQDWNGAFEIRLRLDNRLNITYAVETFALANASYASNAWYITIKDNDNPSVLVKSVVAENNVIFTNTTTPISIKNVTWNGDKIATIGLKDKLPSTIHIMKGDLVKITNYTKVATKLSLFDVFVIHGFIPDYDYPFVRDLIGNVTNNGKGLFFWGGYYPALTDEAGPVQTLLFKIIPVILTGHFTVEENLYIDQSWVGQIELKVNDAYPYNSNVNDFTLLQRTVVWESSPLVKERIFVEDAKANASVLVYQPQQGRTGKIFTRGEPLVAYTPANKGRVLWVSMCSGQTTAIFSKYTTQGAGPNWNRVPIPGKFELHQTEANKPFYLWPYFNFFLYQSSMFLANKTAAQINDYASWPLSPIPHTSQAVMWMMFVAALWVFNFVLFFTLGRRKKAAGAPAAPAEGAPTTPESPESKETKPGSEEMTAEERKAAEEKPEGKVMEEPGQPEEASVPAGPRGPAGPGGPGIESSEPRGDESKEEDELLSNRDEEKPEDDNS